MSLRIWAGRRAGKPAVGGWVGRPATGGESSETRVEPCGRRRVARSGDRPQRLAGCGSVGRPPTTIGGVWLAWEVIGIYTSLSRLRPLPACPAGPKDWTARKKMENGPET